MRAHAQSVADLLQEGASVRHAVVPLYPEGSARLSAVVRVDRTFVDYQRRGFFRIGMFPVAVLDGVTVEARDTGNPLASLETIRHWTKMKPSRHLELRRFKFIFSPTNHVEAGLVRGVGGDDWELLNGVRYFANGNEILAPRASLQMAGARRGELTLETSTGTIHNMAMANPSIQVLANTLK